MLAKGALVAIVVALVVGCVPTRSTIGGHTEAELQQWAVEASDRCVARTHRPPPNPFTTDGCTLSPDCTWQMCCVTHDMDYWCGGSAADRLAADSTLRSCVVEHGASRRAAQLMYWAVRIGGHPLLPVYWRWGYGWSWPRGYGEPGDAGRAGE